jgi:pantoate--beta-alanine ligase
MKICTKIEEARSLSWAARSAGQRLGLVPTMGALHEGHLSLVRAAKAQCQVVAVSIFVNPLQFGPNEDFSKYPRTFDRDCGLLEKEGVDLIFAPSAAEMYPQGAVTYVNVEGLSERLDGRSRPGHFRGVTTVVSKLFHIIAPVVAFFGQKDAAQVAVIRRMVRDLDMVAEIVACPIVREPDGLAMSSRNAYLDREQRQRALVLRRALLDLENLFTQGGRNAARFIDAGKAVLRQEPSVRLDYLEVVNPDTLEAVETVTQDTLVAIAAYVDATRLIDNVILKP